MSGAADCELLTACRCSKPHAASRCSGEWILLPRSCVRRRRFQRWTAGDLRSAGRALLRQSKPWRNAAVPELDRMHVSVTRGDWGFLRLELPLVNLFGRIRYCTLFVAGHGAEPEEADGWCPGRGVRGAVSVTFLD